MPHTGGQCPAAESDQHGVERGHRVHQFQTDGRRALAGLEIQAVLEQPDAVVELVQGALTSELWQPGLDWRVVRVIEVEIFEYQSLINRSLASGICIMALVASATDCRRQMPIAATIAIISNTTPKPAAKRVPTFQFFMRLSLFCAGVEPDRLRRRYWIAEDASTGE